MAFGNFGYPASYQPQYFQQPVQSQNSILWVQGEAGAKAYPVAPGNSVVLMDSEAEYFYIKSTDVSGVPMPLRKFTYKEMTNTAIEQPQTEPVDISQFITRQEFDELKQTVNNKLNNNNNRRDKRDEQIIPRNTSKQYDR